MKNLSKMSNYFRWLILTTSMIGYPNFWSTSKLPPTMVDDAILCEQGQPPMYGAYQPTHQFQPIANQQEQSRVYHQVPTPQGLKNESRKQKTLHLKPSQSAQQMSQFANLAQTPSGSRIPPSTLPLQVFEQQQQQQQQQPTVLMQEVKDAKKGWAKTLSQYSLNWPPTQNTHANWAFVQEALETVASNCRRRRTKTGLIFSIIIVSRLTVVPLVTSSFTWACLKTFPKRSNLF